MTVAEPRALSPLQCPGCHRLTVDYPPSLEDTGAAWWCMDCLNKKCSAAVVHALIYADPVVGRQSPVGAVGEDHALLVVTDGDLCDRSVLAPAAHIPQLDLPGGYDAGGS